MSRLPRKPVKPGVLRFSLTEARNLPDKKKGDGYWNPFCLLGPVDESGNHIQDKLERTPTVKRTMRPSWNTTYNFPISPEFKGLMLEIWDEDKKPQFLGQVIFPPEILLDGRDLSTWFSLTHRSHETQKAKASIKGDVYVSLLYMSDEYRENYDPEGWAEELKKREADEKAKQAAEKATNQPPIEEGSRIRKVEKKMDQIDEIQAELRGGKPEGTQHLLNYILITTTFSTEESLDPQYVKNALDKGAIDSTLQGLHGDNLDFKCLACAFFGRLDRYDQSAIDLLFQKGAVRKGLEAFLSLTNPTIEQLKNATLLFNLARHQECKKMCVELNVIPKLFEILRSNLNSAETSAYCCKSLNQILSEIGENSVPSKKDLAIIIIECGGLKDALSVCATFSDNEDVIEQWFPLIDSCVDNATNLDAVGVEGVDKLLLVMQKHRFVNQVTGVSILARLADADENKYAKHIVQTGVGIPLLIKILSTESNLVKAEQKSREVSLKCLNRCAAFPEGLEQMKANNLPKAIDFAMRGYGNAFIIQIQGILLIKAFAKDEQAKQMLRDINVGSLLSWSASKQSVTRLQKLVKEIKETCGF